MQRQEFDMQADSLADLDDIFSASMLPTITEDVTNEMLEEKKRKKYSKNLFSKTASQKELINKFDQDKDLCMA